MCGLSKRTVVRAVTAGRIKAARTVGGHYRISLAEARRFMAGRGLDASLLKNRESCALVVARDQFVGNLLADVLARSGLELLQAEGLFEAGTMCSRYQPALVILDAAAAGPEAVAACRGMARSECCRDARLLVLAGKSAGEPGRFRQAGAHGVLGKPFSVAELKATLRDLGITGGKFGRVAR